MQSHIVQPWRLEIAATQTCVRLRGFLNPAEGRVCLYRRELYSLASPQDMRSPTPHLLLKPAFGRFCQYRREFSSPALVQDMRSLHSSSDEWLLFRLAIGYFSTLAIKIAATQTRVRLRGLGQ